jgi:hypothetical protein
MHAVTVFEMAAGLARDGVAGPVTMAALDQASRLRPRSANSSAVEVDLRRQLLLVAVDGRRRPRKPERGRLPGITWPCAVHERGHGLAVGDWRPADRGTGVGLLTAPRPLPMAARPNTSPRPTTVSGTAPYPLPGMRAPARSTTPSTPTAITPSDTTAPPSRECRSPVAAGRSVGPPDGQNASIPMGSAGRGWR